MRHYFFMLLNYKKLRWNLCHLLYSQSKFNFYVYHAKRVSNLNFWNVHFFLYLSYFVFFLSVFCDSDVQNYWAYIHYDEFSAFILFIFQCVCVFFASLPLPIHFALLSVHFCCTLTATNCGVFFSLLLLKTKPK